MRNHPSQSVMEGGLGWSAALLLAVLLLPAPAFAQEPAGTESPSHTVVRGNTLWDLARTFYGNPFEWRRIHEANLDRIRDPHWIYPGQVFRIPGAGPEGRVLEVTVVPGTPAEAQEAPMPAMPAARTAEVGSGDRTVFFESHLGGGLRGAQAGTGDVWYAVPRDIVYAAEWLVPEGDVEHLGVIQGFSGPAAPRIAHETVGPYERVRVGVAGAAPGDQLLSFRPVRTVPGVGQVLRPTGLLTVSRVDPAGAVAVAVNEYDRVRIGDLVVPAPRYTLRAGVHPSPVEDGREATVLEFGRSSELHAPGTIVFLDVGSSQAIAVGDEYEVVAGTGEGWTGEVSGRLQVVKIGERVSSARVVRLDAPVLRPGMRVRLTGKMP